ncbi:MAG: NUDIX hydrolase [Candidatus Acidiferrales bacterium]
MKRARKQLKKKATGRLKVLSSAVLCHGRTFTVRHDEVLEPNGIKAARDIIAHPGSVVIIPVLADGRIVLIRQFRYAAKQYLWELVAGHKEPGEDPAKGAHRELIEETGYRAESIRKLFEIFPSPGLLGERMDIYLAEGLTKGKARPEDDEKISQKIVTLAEAERWIREAKICDAKTIAGLLYYSKFARRRAS